MTEQLNGSGSSEGRESSGQPRQESKEPQIPQDMGWNEFALIDPYNPQNPDNIKRQLSKEAEELSAQAPEPSKEAESLFERPDILEAQEVMAEDFFGPEEVKKAFEVDLAEDEIPEIPFSRAELEHFKTEGFFLSLRINYDKDGNPLTIKQMKALYETDPNDPDTRIFYGQDWYEKPDNNDPFYDTQTPKVQWALTKKEVLPNSTSKNYQAQKQLLRRYAQSQSSHLGPGHTIQRREAVDIVYDQILTFRSKGERLLPDRWDWSKTKLTQGADRGFFASVGYFHSGGFVVNANPPGPVNGALGVCPSAVSS